MALVWLPIRRSRNSAVASVFDICVRGRCSLSPFSEQEGVSAYHIIYDLHLSRIYSCEFHRIRIVIIVSWPNAFAGYAHLRTTVSQFKIKRVRIQVRSSRANSAGPTTPRIAIEQNPILVGLPVSQFRVQPKATDPSSRTAACHTRQCIAERPRRNSPAPSQDGT